MKKKQTIWIISLASVALLGLVLIQMSWLQAGIRLQKQRLDNKLCHVLQEVHQKITENACLNSQILESIQKAHLTKQKPQFLPKTNHAIRHIIDSLFLVYRVEIQDYQYKIFDQAKECTVKSQMNQEYADVQFYQVNLGEKINTSIQRTCYQSANYQLGINFPNQYNYLLGQLSGQLAVTFLFILILLACFIFTVWKIFHQKQMAEIKNDFINNLTHELKTPIFSISLISKVFRKNLGDVSKTEKYLDLIENETEQLKQHVEKVLQIALLENKKMQLDLQEIDLHQVIQKTVLLFEFIAEQKQGNILLSLNAQHSKIKADETHIGHLLQNLLDNALKYTQISPQIELITENQAGGIRLIIKDNGIGIKDKDQKQIFEKFYRVSTGNLHQVKGFGLGLSYVKMIVEAHQGIITLQSKWNQGSEFQIYLPAK